MGGKGKDCLVDWSNFRYICSMKKHEPVNLKKEVVEKVRDNKKSTGVPISTFFEQAAEEKLNKEKK